jgi:hypothetical protein
VGKRCQEPFLCQLAINEYGSGYDVHMYDEDDVDARYGDGAASDEIVNAAQHRGITSVAILGRLPWRGSLAGLRRLFRANLP